MGVVLVGKCLALHASHNTSTLRDGNAGDVRSKSGGCKLDPRQVWTTNCCFQYVYDPELCGLGWEGPAMNFKSGEVDRCVIAFALFARACVWLSAAVPRPPVPGAQCSPDCTCSRACGAAVRGKSAIRSLTSTHAVPCTFPAHKGVITCEPAEDARQAPS